MNGKNISSVDGRYYEKTQTLSEYFSEFGLMKYRVLMECEFLIVLLQTKGVNFRKISPKEVKQIQALYQNFNEESYQKIKAYEKTTNHDVKAVEYFIKDCLKENKLNDLLEWVHFGLTSEDTNNCTYGLMLALSVKTVLVPKLTSIINTLSDFAQKNKSLPMLARTHGQPASPTTMGKEFIVFKSRLERQAKQLRDFKIQIKLNGASGNYNALHSAFPKVNWIKFTNYYTRHLGNVAGVKFEVNLLTTQIESHDTYAELSDILRRINVILLDFNQDIWRYISDGYIVQRTIKGEVGSSTMPHKVNPIDFENSEGNLGVANALLNFFSQKLPISRLQRDLSDSTVERVFGTAFGHIYLAYLSLEKGLSKISVNEAKVKEDLENHAEVVAEAIQTVLRRENYPIPYEALKELTRGKKVTMNDFKTFIQNLNVSDKVKAELNKFTPLSYIGLADKLF
jgi:adenylosuccinate lyase